MNRLTEIKFLLCTTSIKSIVGDLAFKLFKNFSFFKAKKEAKKINTEPNHQFSKSPVT